MTEQEWLSSSDPARLWNWLWPSTLASNYVATERKMRLLASACSEVCDCPNIRPSDWFRYLQNPNYGWESNCKATKAAPNLIRIVFGNPFRPVELSRTKAQVLAAQSTIIGCCNRHADNMGCDCLSMAADPWLSSEVLAIAQACYDLRDPAYFPLIWDALEEAGCNNVEIENALKRKQRCPKCLGEGQRWKTDHDNNYSTYIPCVPCHGTGWLPIPGEPFCVRGFWVVDLLLGKS